ncbi:MAG: TIGR04282 family arsenosugar biosynthesis glycosyltransferase [Cyanobacteria bacterium P01_A01_bin.116]
MIGRSINSPRRSHMLFNHSASVVSPALRTSPPNILPNTPANALVNSPANAPANEQSCCLLLFMRYPQAGRTKTRLIPALGAAGAADLQQQMSEYLLRRIARPEQWQLQIHFTGAGLAAMERWLGVGWDYQKQVEGDLGDRIKSAFQTAFQVASQTASRAGHSAIQSAIAPKRVIAIGADCPDISAQHIQQAFDALVDSEVVVGPASDGGYYLIGLRQSPHQSASSPVNRQLENLFGDIDWSTPRVFQQTQAKIQQLGLSLAQLEVLSDIDRPEDLSIWERLQAVQPVV